MQQSVLLTLALCAAAVRFSSGVQCPGGITLVDTFNTADGALWSACEDLQQPGGAVALVSATNQVEWFEKTYEIYGSAPLGSDDDYYLGLGKAHAVYNQSDVLAIDLLSTVGGVTWARVASAVPPIRRAGVRAFVGSRGSVADTTFNDAGEDAAGYGFPPALSYVFNLTNIAEGGTPIEDAAKYLNSSLMAEGVLGGHLPIVVFYYPVLPGSPYLPKEATGSRYWTMIASPAPDMKGSREQTVMFRFQQIQCEGANFAPPCTMVGRCAALCRSSHCTVTALRCVAEYPAHCTALRR